MRARKSFDKFVPCNTLALISGATPFSLDITELCPGKVHSSSMYLLMVTFYYDQSMIINSCGLRRICFSVYGKSVARGAFPHFFRFNGPQNLLLIEICTYHHMVDLAKPLSACKREKLMLRLSIEILLCTVHSTLN